MSQRETKSFNTASVEKKWYEVNASGMTLGRLATQVATLLQGKHKPQYTPHADLGDYVIVYNCDELVCSSRDKIYYRSSGRMGGLKQRTLEEQMAVSSTAVMTLAVKRMLKRSPLGRAMLRKLKCYSAEHKHESQQPILLDLNGNKCVTEVVYEQESN